MAKARPEGSESSSHWTATEAQQFKLLVALKKSGEIGDPRRDFEEDLWQYESEACDWIEQEIGVHVNLLADLTREQAQDCFEELGE